MGVLNVQKEKGNTKTNWRGALHFYHRAEGRSQAEIAYDSERCSKAFLFLSLSPRQRSNSADSSGAPMTRLRI